MKRERLRIGAVASQARVNVQTLRYYERRGLLKEPERTASGYREYPSETVKLIRFIKRAQELGFTLTEIEELLLLRAQRGRDRKDVRVVAEAKLADIDEKIRRLQSLRRALGVLVESCACSKGSPACPILEALDDDGMPPDLVPLGAEKATGGRHA
jgi:Hg(II)-responsive transcriptional regulator